VTPMSPGMFGICTAKAADPLTIVLAATSTGDTDKLRRISDPRAGAPQPNGVVPSKPANSTAIPVGIGGVDTEAEITPGTVAPEAVGRRRHWLGKHPGTSRNGDGTC
jgi:hypothetical protein